MHSLKKHLGFPPPTCPFRSAPTTIFSVLGTLVIKSSQSFKNSSFIVSVSPLCGAYADTMLNISPAITSFSLISLSDGLDTSTTFSLNSGHRMTPTPFLPLFSPLYKILNPSPNFLALLPVHLVSCTHRISIFLLLHTSTSSLPLPVIDPTFQLPILTFLSFLSTIFFSCGRGLRSTPRPLLMSTGGCWHASPPGDALAISDNL